MSRSDPDGGIIPFIINEKNISGAGQGSHVPGIMPYTTREVILSTMVYVIYPWNNMKHVCLSRESNHTVFLRASRIST